MSDALPLPLLIALPASLLAASLLPDSRRWSLPHLVSRLAGLGAVLSLVVAAIFQLGLTSPAATSYGWFAYNGPVSLMLALVSFIGWITCHYSIRYLDGEARQLHYFRWLSRTLGFVTLLVLSGNLLAFCGFWMLTSFGLHHLLLHYPERPLARRAAWTKFAISRFGDALLLAAAAMIYWQWGTLQFASFGDIELGGGSASSTMPIVLLVLGAIVKTAQFPFHTWLPLTIDTPTPVSALMHAGIVNAGGFLMIQSSELLTQSVSSMYLLTGVGMVTAAYGAIVMMTQSGVKTALTYSTVAQMGFMMFQCGLGAFSAAMLHLVAHSLYKAHAFLSSGGVMSRRVPEFTAPTATVSLKWWNWGLAATCLIVVLLGSGAWLGMDWSSKPGGMMLGAIVFAALICWMADVSREGDHAAWQASLWISSALCLIYVAAYAVVDAAIAADVAAVTDPLTVWFSWMMAAVVLSSAIGFQLLRTSPVLQRALARLQVHASAGFYLDAMMSWTFQPTPRASSST